jgi:Domain of unknown function (DUF6487)
MPDESFDCPRCDAPMKEGFILDLWESGSKKIIEWVEGPPEYGVLGGLKTKKKYQVTTYRCANCGYLESYAHKESY